MGVLERLASMNVSVEWVSQLAVAAQHDHAIAVERTQHLKLETERMREEAEHKRKADERALQRMREEAALKTEEEELTLKRAREAAALKKVDDERRLALATIELRKSEAAVRTEELRLEQLHAQERMRAPPASAPSRKRARADAAAGPENPPPAPPPAGLAERLAAVAARPPRTLRENVCLSHAVLANGGTLPAEAALRAVAAAYQDAWLHRRALTHHVRPVPAPWDATLVLLWHHRDNGPRVHPELLTALRQAATEINARNGGPPAPASAPVPAPASAPALVPAAAPENPSNSLVDAVLVGWGGDTTTPDGGDVRKRALQLLLDEWITTPNARAWSVVLDVRQIQEPRPRTTTAPTTGGSPAPRVTARRVIDVRSSVLVAHDRHHPFTADLRAWVQKRLLRTRDDDADPVSPPPCLPPAASPVVHEVPMGGPWWTTERAADWFGALTEAECDLRIACPALYHYIARTAADEWRRGGDHPRLATVYTGPVPADCVRYWCARLRAEDGGACDPDWTAFRWRAVVDGFGWGEDVGGECATIPTIAASAAFVLPTSAAWRDRPNGKDWEYRLARCVRPLRRAAAVMARLRLGGLAGARLCGFAGSLRFNV